METGIACYCPLCDLPITEDMFDLKVLADNYVYKAGELSYIELAHLACARTDNAANPGRQWSWDVS